MKSFARAFAAAVDHINPIRMFEVEQSGKLAGEFGKFRGWENISQDMSAMKSSYSKAGRGWGGDWWAGHDVGKVGDLLTASGGNARQFEAGMAGMMQNPVYTREMQSRAFYRKAAMGAVAAGTVGYAVMGSNIVTDAGSGVMSAGIGLGAAGAAMSYGYNRGSVGAKILGWGLAGMTARNAMTPGDNWGPF